MTLKKDTNLFVSTAGGYSISWHLATRSSGQDKEKRRLGMKAGRGRSHTDQYHIHFLPIEYRIFLKQ